MKLHMTLAEAFRACDDIDRLCDEFGWSVWAVNEGGGDVEVHLTVEQAKDHGIIKG